MIKIGIAHGDINGISYELMLKTFSDSRIVELCTPVIYGSSKVAAYYRKTLEIPQLNMASINRAEDAAAGRINIINCVSDDIKVELARPTEAAGEAALQALDAATADLKRGMIDAIVTLPVGNRVVMKNRYPVQSSYMEKKFKAGEGKSLTMLIYGDVRFALFTDIIPFFDVPSALTQPALAEKLLLLDKTLRQDFGIVKPRIAVLSLNPKAGAGLAECEEERIITPAMKEVDEQGLMTFGPYSADSFFGSRMYGEFDGIMAMYYDQITGACKALYDTDGVYYTAGIPSVHTAPAHGTAYDIAGKNMASDEPFRSAIYAAIDIFRNRNSYKEATANPLRKHYFDKGAKDESVDLTKDDDSLI